MALRDTKMGFVKVPFESGVFKADEQGLQLAQLSASLDVASVAANVSAEQTFTVAGLAVGDLVFVIKPALSAGLGIVNARVSAADTLAITFMNTTAAGIDPAAETYQIFVMRFNQR
jgi:hypothetical protein